jgi:phosphoribosylanthranilate isomerase
MVCTFANLRIAYKLFMLKTLVKANAITNLTDARYFAAWEVKWLGFCLDPSSPCFVNPAQLLAFREWVGGVELVGEFGNQDLDYILKTTTDLQLDAIQISRPLPPDWAPELGDIPIIEELALSPGLPADALRTRLSGYEPVISHFLLDFTRHGLTWKSIREEGALLPMGELRSLCNEFPILLAFDWSPENLDEILFHLGPVGICLRGGAEEKPGLKSFEELDQLFELLQVEE